MYKSKEIPFFAETVGRSSFSFRQSDKQGNKVFSAPTYTENKVKIQSFVEVKEILKIEDDIDVYLRIIRLFHVWPDNITHYIGKTKEFVFYTGKPTSFP